MTDPKNLEEEFELTFLARNVPREIRGVKPIKMCDTYLPEDADHPHIRLRQKDDKYEITKKQPVNHGDSSHQTEQTIPLELKEYTDLKKISGRSVEKDRYVVSINGHIAEVDVFKGKLSGLVLIDFEFNNHEEKRSFEAPKCCLADVTQEEFVAGGILAGKSYSDIESHLSKFSYKPLMT